MVRGRAYTLDAVERRAGPGQAQEAIKTIVKQLVLWNVKPKPPPRAKALPRVMEI
ncbi:MAG: hypothetical protein JSV50_03675 [Desulfobacteraceae bacterium]|nr:MAG: hypothetical protein JSV50_03675 [Desulfobacteraceae bacterium]